MQDGQGFDRRDAPRQGVGLKQDFWPSLYVLDHDRTIAVQPWTMPLLRVAGDTFLSGDPHSRPRKRLEKFDGEANTWKEVA